MWMLKFYNRKPVWLVLFILCTAVIILLSLIPYSPEMAVKAESGFRWDYLEHFLAFFTFGSLYVIWRSDRNYHMRGTELFVLLIASGGFSFAMEYAQLYVPGRAFNPIDLTCNLAGVLGSILFVYFYLIRHYLRKRYVMPGG
jgi:VanZ family protein